MVYVVMVLHILVCILLILSVMIQGGENVDISAAFGGVSQAAFGPRGAISTLAKITWALAITFAATSITLSVWATRRAGSSVLETPARTTPVKTAPMTPAPVLPGPATPVPTKK